MSDYVPIDCDQHSVLELLAMRHAKVTVEADSGEGRPVTHSGIVVDVLTRAGAEFLVLESAGERVDLRLDRLLAIRGANGTVVWRQEFDKRN